MRRNWPSINDLDKLTGVTGQLRQLSQSQTYPVFKNSFKTPWFFCYI